MHVGLVLLNSHLGGTEKRFANLFNHLSGSAQHRYTLVIPSGLLRLLIEQGLLRADQPGIAPIFAEAPYSVYSHLPLVWAGVTFGGLTRTLAPLWRRGLSTKPVRHLFDSFDLIHYALPTSYLLGALPFDRPVVVEAQD